MSLGLALGFLFVMVVIAVSVYIYVKNSATTSNCAALSGTANVQTYVLSSNNTCVANLCMTGYGIDIKGTPSSSGMCYAYVNPSQWTFTPSTDIWSPNITYSTSSSKEDCAEKCANNSACTMAVLNQGFCYLKGKDDKAYTLSNPDSVAITKGAPPAKK